YIAVTQKVFSQEVRLTSPGSKRRASWVAGAYYSDARTREADSSIGSPPVPSEETAITQHQIAAFGQIALRFLERVTASAGVRVGHGKYAFVTQRPPTVHGEGAEGWVAPRFVVSYQANESTLAYLSAAKGYGSGGVYPAVNFCDQRPTPFPPDSIWSFE